MLMDRIKSLIVNFCNLSAEFLIQGLTCIWLLLIRLPYKEENVKKNNTYVSL